MKRNIILSSLLLCIAALTGCVNNYDDFEIAGKVIDNEYCTSIQDMGYAVQLTSPDSVGGDYKASDNKVYKNVVVVYGADQIIKTNKNISGRIYLDPRHSESECNYHFREQTGDVPEACFTKLKILSD